MKQELINISQKTSYWVKNSLQLLIDRIGHIYIYAHTRTHAHLLPSWSSIFLEKPTGS